MVLTFVQKENCYGCFTSSKNGIVGFIGAFFLVYVVGCASLQDARKAGCGELDAKSK
jgi:hypothetical protein